MLNLIQLDTLVTCVESGSFSAAARKLNKAQSAVSTSISNLEIDTNLLIFDRTTRVPTLTAEGKVLYQRAKRLLAEAREIEQMVNQFSHGVESTLHLVISPLLLSQRFYQIVQQFREQFIYTQLSILVTANNDVPFKVKALRESNSHAVLGYMLSEPSLPPEILFGLVGHFSPSLAVGHSHPLATSPEITLRDLESFTQIELHGEALPKMAYPSSAGTVQTNHLETQVALVKQGLGWALLPQNIVTNDQALIELTLSSEEQDWIGNIDRIEPFEQPNGLALDWLRQHSADMFRDMS